MTNNDEKKDRLPSDVRNMIMEILPDIIERLFNLLINITGIYSLKNKSIQFKEQFKRDFSPEIEKYIDNKIQFVKEIAKESETEEYNGVYVKEKFYRIFKSMRPLIDDIPEDVHMLDYFLSIMKEAPSFRLEFSYLKDTKYYGYIETIENLLERLDEQGKIVLVYQFIMDFTDTNDAYSLLQAAFQKMSDYYRFLEQEQQNIRKEQVHKYLEIYNELVGHFEKFVYLSVGLVKILKDDSVPEYEKIKEKRLYANLMFLKQSGYDNLVSGFNRHIRNALAHGDCKIDLINEVVVFYDVRYEFEKSFKELQKATREISANLLVMPNLFLMSLYLALSRFKTIIDKLE